MDDKVLYGYRPIRRQRGATLVRDWEYGSQDPVLILRSGPPPSEAP